MKHILIEVPPRLVPSWHCLDKRTELGNNIGVYYTRYRIAFLKYCRLLPMKKTGKNALHRRACPDLLMVPTTITTTRVRRISRGLWVTTVAITASVPVAVAVDIIKTKRNRRWDTGRVGDASKALHLCVEKSVKAHLEKVCGVDSNSVALCGGASTADYSSARSSTAATYATG